MGEAYWYTARSDVPKLIFYKCVGVLKKIIKYGFNFNIVIHAVVFPHA